MLLRGNRMLWTAALVGCSVVVVGCGTQAEGYKQVDHSQAVALVRKLVARYRGKPLRSVRCPSGILAKPGTTFVCRLVGANGSTATILEHVKSRSGRLAVGIDDLRVTPVVSGNALGTPVTVRNLPQLRPQTRLTLVAGQPIDPGQAENDARGGTFSAAQVWPSTAHAAGVDQVVQVRFVNLPVTVTNVGRAPVRIMITGAATDDQRREAGGVLRSDAAWPGPHGRQPDWTSRQTPPITPGGHITRYITFPIERGSQITEFSVAPNVLYHGAVLEMVPDVVDFRGP
jgi:hypothetical protein